MLRKTTLTLAAGSALLLTAAAFTPASANYGHCDEQPSMPDCRGYDVPGQGQLSTKTIAISPRHAVYRENATGKATVKHASLKQPSLKQASAKQPSTKQASAMQATNKKPEASTRHARSHEAPKSQAKSSS